MTAEILISVVPAEALTHVKAKANCPDLRMATQIISLQRVTVCSSSDDSKNTQREERHSKRSQKEELKT